MKKYYIKRPFCCFSHPNIGNIIIRKSMGSDICIPLKWGFKLGKI